VETIRYAVGLGVAVSAARSASGRPADSLRNVSSTSTAFMQNAHSGENSFGGFHDFAF
jgi:hypothetical protein